MLLFWPLLIPLFTALLALLSRRAPRLRRVWSLTGSVALLVASGWLVAAVSQNGIQHVQGGAWAAPFGITIC